MAEDYHCRELYENALEGLYLSSVDGRFIRVNKAWTDLTGLVPERVIGVNLGRLYPAQLAAPHEVQEQMAMASGQPVNFEEQMLDSDGLPRDVIIRVMPYTGAEGAVSGVIVCLMDVTEFREAERMQSKLTVQYRQDGKNLPWRFCIGTEYHATGVIK